MEASETLFSRCRQLALLSLINLVHINTDGRLFLFQRRSGERMEKPVGPLEPTNQVSSLIELGSHII
jgi:hypothetical protein